MFTTLREKRLAKTIFAEHLGKNIGMNMRLQSEFSLPISNNMDLIQ